MFKHKKFEKFKILLVFGAIALDISNASWANAENATTNECDVKRIGDIIYVDAYAKGKANGKDWGNAYNNLQTALDAAAISSQPSQLWIADGKYVATNSGYKIPSNTQLYGGFIGGEKDFRQRSFEHNSAVLTGKGVARHVVFLGDVTNVVLDGLTIKGGNATGNLNEDELGASNEVRGGGILSLNSDLTVCNSTLKKNRAKKFGGAIYHQGGKLAIIRSKFFRNTVLRGDMEVHDTDMEADTDGGAIAVQLSESLTVSESVFKYNIAGDDAGAIATRKTDVYITKSRFVKNRGIATVLPVFLSPGDSPLDLLVTGMGGAVQIWNEYIGFNNGDQSYRTVIKDSHFRENRSVIAGAAYIETQAGSVVEIDGNEFVNNGGNGQTIPGSEVNEQSSAYGRGAGALMIVGLRWGDQERDANGDWVRPIAKATIKNTLFKNNEGAYGGGVQLLTVDAKVTNSTFIGNVGRQRGGAIWSHNTVSLFDQFGGLEPGIGGMNVERCIFIGNKSLGMSESLSVENFPGVITSSEPSFGGGAISNEALSYAKINKSIFIKNESINSDGGAIHNVSVSIDVLGALEPLSAATYGASLEVDNSIFMHNVASISGSGGAIANGGAQVNGQIANSNNDDVRADAAASDLRVSNSYFKANRAADYGGSLVNWNASVMDVRDSYFVRNKAGNGGGIASIGIAQTLANAKISDSYFGQNRVRRGRGGAILNVFSNLSLNENRFRKNIPGDVEQY